MTKKKKVLRGRFDWLHNGAGVTVCAQEIVRQMWVVVFHSDNDKKRDLNNAVKNIDLKSRNLLFFCLHGNRGLT